MPASHTAWKAVFRCRISSCAKSAFTGFPSPSRVAEKRRFSMSKTVFGRMPIAVKIIACISVMFTGSLIAMSGRTGAVSPKTMPRFMPPPNITAKHHRQRSAGEMPVQAVVLGLDHRLAFVHVPACFCRGADGALDEHVARKFARDRCHSRGTACLLCPARARRRPSRAYRRA